MRLSLPSLSMTLALLYTSNSNNSTKWTLFIGKIYGKTVSHLVEFTAVSAHT